MNQDWGADQYYQSGLGRFLGQDPIGYAGDLNLYAYAANNPTGARDPSGLKVEFQGYSDEELKQVQKIWEMVKFTKRGNTLCSAAEKAPRIYCIVKGIPSAQVEPPLDRHSMVTRVLFDPSFSPFINTQLGRMRATPESVLAHELGHAVMGTGDTGRGNMDNVNQNENPVRRDLGLPLRTTYP